MGQIPLLPRQAQQREIPEIRNMRIGPIFRLRTSGWQPLEPSFLKKGKELDYLLHSQNLHLSVVSKSMLGSVKLKL